MIYGKVYGRSSVLARFLIEISSHARHNNFSRTCKHERRSRVCSIFSTWTWTIILFDRSASIALNVCIRWSVCEPCSYSFTIHRYVHDNKVVRNCRRAFSYSLVFSWAAAREKNASFIFTNIASPDETFMKNWSLYVHQDPINSLTWKLTIVDTSNDGRVVDFHWKKVD